jgi:hypothetical protein
MLTLWLLAAVALLVSWRLRESVADGPSSLLGLAVAVTPGGRREWSEAMTAELAGLTGRAERWRFALSCVPAALFPPRRPIRRGQPAPMVRVTATLGLVLAGLGIVAVAFLLVRYHEPGPVGLTPIHDPFDLTITALAFLAALWLTVTTPGILGTDRLACRAGVATGLAVGFFVFSIGAFAVLLAVVVVPFTTAAVAVQQSFRSGVRAALWAAAFTTLASIPAFVVSALISFTWTGEIWYGDGVQRAGIVDELAAWVVPWTLGALLPVMIVGAAIGAAIRRATQPRLEP